MTEFSGTLDFPPLNLPEEVKRTSVDAGEPGDPVFGAGSRWPTKGMLRVMLKMMEVKPIESELRDYCLTLPSNPVELIDHYNLRFGPNPDDGDPLGYMETVANCLKSDGENFSQFDTKPETEKMVRDFMDACRAKNIAVDRSFAREMFLNQLVAALASSK